MTTVYPDEEYDGEWSDDDEWRTEEDPYDPPNGDEWISAFRDLPAVGDGPVHPSQLGSRTSLP
jgi:hypothetical protein